MKEIEEIEIIKEKCDLARDENTSVDLLRELSKEEDKNIRSLVAANKNSPEDVLNAFLSDINHVQEFLAMNANCPELTLRSLAKSNNGMIRNLVAANLKCPVDVL